MGIITLQCKSGAIPATPSSSNACAHYRTYNCTTGHNPSSYSGIRLPDEWLSAKSVLVNGKNPPGWRERVANGELLPYTAYSVQRTGCKNTPGVLNPNFCYSGYRYNEHSSGDAISLYSMSWATIDTKPYVDVDALLQEAWAKAKAGASQILVDMAERRETYELLKRAHSRFADRLGYVARRTAKSLKQRKWRTNYGATPTEAAKKALSDSWMEYRYGWTPLVYSMRDIADALEKMQKSKTAIYRERVSKSAEVLGSFDHSCWVSYQRLQNGAFPVMGIRNYHKRTLTARASVAYQVSSHVPKAFDINPLMLGWELVPLSFVADWFLNVPTIFQAHWPGFAISASTACVSEKDTEMIVLEHGDITWNPISGNPAVRLLERPRFTGFKESYIRTPRSDIPLKLSYQPHITWERMLDATVLLDKMLGKRIAGLAKAFKTSLLK